MGDVTVLSVVCMHTDVRTFTELGVLHTQSYNGNICLECVVHLSVNSKWNFRNTKAPGDPGTLGVPVPVPFLAQKLAM